MPDPEQNVLAARYLRKLSYGVGRGSPDAVEESTAESLSPAHVKQALEQAVETFKRETGAPLAKPDHDELERIFLQDGIGAIDRLKKEGVRARLPDAEVDALEAIVQADGSRPTIRLKLDDTLDLGDPALVHWKSAAKKFQDQIAAAAASVGRIDLNGKHVGTGFVVTDRLILTNRHVLQDLATEDSGDWTFKGQPTITFDVNPNQSRERQFKLRRKVVVTGPDEIVRYPTDFNRLDFAVLEVDPSDDAPALPPPLPLESDAKKILERRPIFTIGYPARPPEDAYDSDVLARLFQHRYGVKRFAPGEIGRGLGSAVERTGETVFAHDATTLAGNSGSCVVDLGNDGRLVVGLHFAGSSKSTNNYAHSNARLRGSLGDLGLTWKEWFQAW
jgi:hypothetical protein